MDKISFSDRNSRFLGSDPDYLDRYDPFLLEPKIIAKKRDLKRFSVSVSFLVWLIVLESNQNHTLLADLDTFKSSKSRIGLL